MAAASVGRAGSSGPGAIGEADDTEPGMMVPSVYSFIPPYMQQRLLGYYTAMAQRLLDDGKALSATTGGSGPSAGGFPSPASLMQQLQEASNKLAGEAMQGGAGFQSSVAAAAIRGRGSPSPREVWDGGRKPPIQLLPASAPCMDQDANVCYENMGAADSFYETIFSVFPVNNSTHLMRSYVHHPQAFNNAFWHPSKESVFFGEVDPNIFTPFVHNLGILTHEFGHAVTQYNGRLRYYSQSGALNESVSDVFAVTLKQLKANISANKPDCDWLIGEGIVINPTGTGTAIRSMRDPGSAYKDHPVLGTDAQVGHMKDYINMTDDNGGVHLNSGIPNRAFYLAASQIGRGSWEVAAPIWYAALQNSADDTFATFAWKTLDAIKRLRYTEDIFNIVGQAWQTVGVDLRIAKLPGSTDKGGGWKDTFADGLKQARDFLWDNKRDLLLLGGGAAVGAGGLALYQNRSRRREDEKGDG